MAGLFSRVLKITTTAKLQLHLRGTGQNKLEIFSQSKYLSPKARSEQHINDHSERPLRLTVHGRQMNEQLFDE